MASDPTTPTPSLEEVVKAVLAEAKASDWMGRFVVPASAITGALGTFVCVCWLSLLTLGSGPAPAPPAPPAPVADIALPATLTGPVGRAIPLEAQTNATEVKWWCADTGDLVVGSGKKAAFVAPKAGQYTVLAWTSLKGHPTDAAVCVITVGDPPPPVPPVPPVPPTPPTPPSPIPGDGYRVLIVYDPKALGTYKPGQLDAIFGEKVRSFIAANCVKGADGKTPEGRILPATTDMSNETKLWQDAMKLPRPSLPWLFVANGDKGASLALPERIEDTIAALNSAKGK